MPRYRVSASVIGSKYLGEFEADTPEEAEDMARKSDTGCVCLCHQCSSECEDPEIDEVSVEEITGEPS